MNYISRNVDFSRFKIAFFWHHFSAHTHLPSLDSKRIPGFVGRLYQVPRKALETLQIWTFCSVSGHMSWSLFLDFCRNQITWCDGCDCWEGSGRGDPRGGSPWIVAGSTTSTNTTTTRQIKFQIQGAFSLGLPLKFTSTEKLILAGLGVSRTIYVNVDSPNLCFPYFNFLGGYQWNKLPCTIHIDTNTS